jgi:CubicO group peptidase (beta-lactamase class C family)
VDVAIDHGQDDSSRDVSDSTEGWDWLGAFLKGRGLAGVAIAVADEAGERFFVSKGWAELRRKAIDRDTLFELGSVGKTFTALLVLQLVDEGAIDLGAPVTSYLPWFEVRSEFAPITVEHLLTHSAGLIRGADMSADSRFDVWALRQTQTGFPPGERHYYSNVGFRTLGYMVEDVTGLRYPELVRTRLLEPLGLTGMAPELTADVRLRLAVGYERLHDDRVPDPADPLVPAPWVDTDTGDGCLAGTAGDLLALARYLLDGSAERLTGGLLLQSDDDGWSYGYGLERKNELVRHGGSMPGQSCTMLGDLETGLAVAVLLNGPDENDVTEEVADYALALARGESLSPPGDPEPRRLTPVVEPLEEWSDVYGRYRAYNPWTPGFRVVQWETGLGLVYPWGQEKPLAPLGKDSFRVGAAWSPERVRFDAVVNGRALRANLSGESYYRSDFP